MILQRFDIAENVVPTTTIQPHDVVTQVVENFIHLKNGRECFNKNRRLDGSAWQIYVVLSKTKDLTPPRRFLIGLCFWQIKIGATAFFQQGAIVVEKVQREIKQTARNGFSVP